jgi:hypothetical protein
MISVAGDLVINDIGNPTLTSGIIARTSDPNGGNAGRIAVTADNICFASYRGCRVRVASAASRCLDELMAIYTPNGPEEFSQMAKILRCGR